MARSRKFVTVIFFSEDHTKIKNMAQKCGISTHKFILTAALEKLKELELEFSKK